MKFLYRLLRWVGSTVAIITLLVLTASGETVLLTMPGNDLATRIEGLAEPVQITIDAYGVPRVHAANEVDAAAAMGFLHARERMFQMDMMRRAARGELSELFGTSTLRLDKFNRLLNLRDRVEADLPLLSEQTRAMLDAYANGVNAWIKLRGRFSSLEFAALGAPRPWTATDSLLWGKTMGLYLSGNWRTELARLSLSASMGRLDIENLWPSDTLHVTTGEIPPALSDTATRLAEMLPNFPDAFTLPSSASNEWAVDGEHSATGAPILAGDPHLSYGLPPIWYLARIETPKGVLAGATAPGVPFMVIGHNGHLAWTFTTTGADVQDLFIETPVEGGYLTETGPRPFIQRSEVIQVRGGPSVHLDVRETRHGPIISDLVTINGATDGKLLALSMANLAPGDTAADGLLSLNHADSQADAAAAAAQMTSPVQNLLVAGRKRIGFYTTGRLPIRRSGDGAFPARGDDGSQDWVGWAKGEALPHSTSPASGRLVNANERTAPPDFQTFLGRDWNGDTRARRIREMLDSHPQATVADFVGMQTDDLDLIAVDLLPQLRKIEPLLDGWDGRMSIGSAAPLIFNAWMIEFSHQLLAPYKVPETGSAAVQNWPDLVHTALQHGALCKTSCPAVLQTSHDAAMAALRQRFGDDPAKWHWGDAHQAVFPTLLLRAIPVLGAIAEVRIPAIGDDSTVGRGGLREDNFQSIHGAAFRSVYDLADLDRSQFVIAPGQSGDPASPLARNFVRKWRDGGTIAIAAAPEAVSARIRLSP